MRLGFVGLGRMGEPMTRNLLRAGHAVTVHNRSQGPVERLVEAGAIGAASPAQVAQAAEIVFTCLPSPASVELVYLGADGLLASAREGQVLIDCSTVSPALSRSIYQAALERGAAFLDVPVSGGPEGAQAATLTIMAGGDDEPFQKALPALQAMGNNVHHVGPSGAGSAVKLANQLLVGVHTAAAVEAAVLATKAGVDPQVLLDIVSTSYGGSTMFRRTLTRVIDRDFEPGSPMSLLLKDLELIHEVSHELGVRVMLGSLSQEIFKEARALGLGERDMASLVQPAERVAGVEVRSSGNRES